jgi:hypothetical protein
MLKPVHFAAIAAVFGVTAASFTVDLAGPRAESPLQFMMKQNREREASRPAYPTEAVPVRGEGFFSEMFEFEFGEERAPRAPTYSNLQRVVCKRQCDGAQMVMGFMPARSRQKEAEAMCAAAGGGAATQLVLEKFVPGQGFAPVEMASSEPVLQEGRASLNANATARPAATGGCPQSAAVESHMTVPILHDATLRNGDVVVTKAGLKVFIGGGKPPFKDKDFVALDSRKKVAADLRQLKVAGN